MTIAKGVAKTVAYAKESTFGVMPAAGTSQIVRRVASLVELTKSTYQSQEIRADAQIADMRHGVHAVKGDIKGEISPGTYAPFIGSILRQVFTAGVTSGAITTVTAAAGSPGTFTLSSGSWLTMGFKVGDVVRHSGWTTTGVANNAKNFRITALTATVMSCNDVAGPINTSTVASKAAGDSVTVSVYGKKALVPLTGQTLESYTIEHRYQDVGVYEQFTGCRITDVDMNLPATGMTAITVSVMGQDMASAGTAYFTSPTAAAGSGVLAAVNGKLSYDGLESGILTSLDVKISGTGSAGACIGSNVTPDVFVGSVMVTGTLSAYFQSSAIQLDFLQENLASLSFVMTTNSTATADFVAINIPSLKLTGGTRTDDMKGVTITAPFQALLNSAGGTGTATDATTISIQDSLA